METVAPNHDPSAERKYQQAVEPLFARSGRLGACGIPLHPFSIPAATRREAGPEERHNIAKLANGYLKLLNSKPGACG